MQVQQDGRKLKCKLLHRIRSRLASKVGSNRSSSLGSDWLQRTSGSSWDWSDCGSDEDEECYLPKDVPQGYLAVYVGSSKECDKKRFVVSARHLSHPWFQALLQRSAEEFGFEHKGGLTLPCEIAVFENLLKQHSSGSS